MSGVTVTFVTLFLTLVTGPQVVEVAVTGDVTAVEFRLDGETVGVRRGKPWKVACDFGTLRPLVLEAIAFDAEGTECARERQVVNLPRPLVESSIVLEQGPDSRPTGARIIWQSAKDLEPTSVEVRLDGESIEVVDPRRISLPPVDPVAIHFLSARVEFPGGLISHSEMTFGGPSGAEARTDLTAVPVVMAQRKRRLSPGDLEGRLLARGKPASVTAIEQTQPHLVVIVDPFADDVLHAIEEARLRSGAYSDFPLGLSPEKRNAETVRALLQRRSSGGTVQLLSAGPRPATPSVSQLELYPLTEPFSLFRDGLTWLLCHHSALLPSGPRQQITDAVAVAGLRAAHSPTPRGVLLVLGSDTDRTDRTRPEDVRNYLRALNVPLVVWTTAPGAHVDAWGRAENVASPSMMNRAIVRLLHDLRRQVVVWLDGAYLPNEITASASTEVITLAR